MLRITDDAVLLAYLHTPPDKALDRSGHIARACMYATTVLGRSVPADELAKHADHVGSALERLTLPNDGEGGPAIAPVGNELTVFHPLSGAERQISVPGLAPHDVRQTLQSLLPNGDSMECRFLSLWRLWPEALQRVHAAYGSLPADTRIPDHTIWHHLDIGAGLEAALAGSGSAAFLSFALGPVQQFIAAARTVRDLWSGSMILSWLSFQGMLPIIKRLGPTALVYPALRGIPVLDLWLRREKGLAKIDAPAADMVKSPCLPNRFLAVVPWGAGGTEAAALAQQCREAAASAWYQLSDTVRRGLATGWAPGWDRGWTEQVEAFFEIQTAVLPWKEADDATLAKLIAGEDQFDKAFPAAAAVRALADAIPEQDQTRYQSPTSARGQVSGAWQARLELSARLMQAQRSIRQVPAATQGDPVPPKCSLLGTYEQMGPPGLQESAAFWRDAAARWCIGGVRLGERERLCAVALVKRFCGPAFFVEELGLADPRQLRFADTATIAAARWLEQAREAGFDWLKPDRVRERHHNWSGQWLHWARAAQDADESCPPEVFAQIKKARDSVGLGKPPAYYGVLMLDGDALGEWLRGDRSPTVGELMHPELRDGYFRKLGDARVEAALQQKRPVGPALHAALSEALANFALRVVPEVVRRHHGTLIYAGGDDVLALLPTSTALDCACELRRAYSGRRDVNGGAAEGYYRAGNREFLMMGPTATLSAGLAVVHYKEDLRFALAQARLAEKRAKDGGRDALQITVCRRSGEHASALCPWDEVPRVNAWVAAFLGKASDRWAYHLKQELPTLRGVDVDAMRAEIKRQVGRAEDKTRRLLGESRTTAAADLLASAFDAYRAAVTNNRRDLSDAAALENFITLCQTASFLARGRDA